MRKILFSVIMLAVACVSASAQNFQRYNFGEGEFSSFNPASAITDGSNAYFRGRYEWVNTTDDLYAEKPYNFEVGGTGAGKWGAVSALLNYDEYSFFKRHYFQVNYSYRWCTGVNKDHFFSIGGGFSMGIDDINTDKMSYEPCGNFVACAPDFNLGFEYVHGNLRTGLGATNILSTYTTVPMEYKGSVTQTRMTRNPRAVVAYLRYRWDIKGVVGIAPIIYAGYCERALFEADLCVDYKKIVSLSYGFRALDLRHLIHLDLAIPKTPVVLDVSFASSALCYGQTLSAGVKVKL